MTPNKSIDGLTTRDAKKSPKTVTKIPVKAPEAKPKANPRPVVKKAPVAIPIASRTAKIPVKKPLENPIIEDSLIIEVASEDAPDAQRPAPIQASHEQAVEEFLKPVQAFNLGENNELIESEKPVKNTQPANEPKDTPVKDTAEPKASKKSKKPLSKKRKIFIGIGISVVVLLLGALSCVLLWGNDIIAKITGGKGNIFDLFTFVDEKYEPLATDANGRTNILAFGTSGFDMNGEGFDGVHAGAKLTDSIMMISLNQETGDIAMLSLPRDLKASPTCTSTGKINEVYWCHNMYDKDEDAGATALMREVGAILGVDFQYYAHLNWGALESIVDTLGGVTITLDEDINDYYYTGAVYKAGVEYNISGFEAVALSRARHGTMGGDFSRGASQQKILIGIKDKLISKHLSVPDLISLANTLGDNLRTNFSVENLKTLAHLTSSFDFNSMRQLSLFNPDENIYYMTTGTLENGISYVFPSAGVGKYTDIQKYVKKNLSNNPRDYENSTIIVLNAVGIVGLASAERDKLTAEEYTNISIDDAPEGEYPTGFTLYSKGTKPNTQTLLEKFYEQEASSFDDLPANVTRDYDFVVILNPNFEE